MRRQVGPSAGGGGGECRFTAEAKSPGLCALRRPPRRQTAAGTATGAFRADQFSGRGSTAQFRTLRGTEKGVTMSVISSTPELASPFPGLRPFKSHEDAFFFGRHEQISDMLQRLETCRLLTVVGASGCGKSSLVRAGLLPALHDGLLFGAGSEWRTVMLKPGTDPYRELARGLVESLPAPDPSDSGDWLSYVQAMLLSGDNGLIRVVNEAGL